MEKATESGKARVGNRLFRCSHLVTDTRLVIHYYYYCSTPFVSVVVTVLTHSKQPSLSTQLLRHTTLSGTDAQVSSQTAQRAVIWLVSFQLVSHS